MKRLVVVLLMLGACGSSSITSQPGDGPTVIEHIDAPPDGPCTKVSDCDPGEVCNTSTGECVTSLPCTTHTQCGGEAYCTEGGICAPSVPHGPCDNDQNCIGQEACNPDTHICGCGGQQLTTEIVVPNMLIALDRSQSMNMDVPGTGSPLLSRWDVAKTAIGNLTTTYEDRIRFGLVLWPGPNQACSGGTQCMGSVYGVSIAPLTAGTIDDYLDSAGRCSLGTPIVGTLNGLASFGDLGDANHPEYVVLITDGEDTCVPDNQDDVAQATTATNALRMRNPEVKTFAIGFSGDVDADILTAIANAGGTARAGDPKYFQANSPAALQAAFDEIAGVIASCTFTLSSQPGDPDRLFVYVGGTQIPRDLSHTSGWDYNAATMQLSFYGATCVSIQGGGGGDLAVSYGCPIIGKPSEP